MLLEEMLRVALVQRAVSQMPLVQTLQIALSQERLSRARGQKATALYNELSVVKEVRQGVEVEPYRVHRGNVD